MPRVDLSADACNNCASHWAIRCKICGNRNPRAEIVRPAIGIVGRKFLYNINLYVT